MMLSLIQLILRLLKRNYKAINTHQKIYLSKMLREYLSIAETIISQIPFITNVPMI